MDPRAAELQMLLMLAIAEEIDLITYAVAESNALMKRLGVKHLRKSY